MSTAATSSGRTVGVWSCQSDNPMRQEAFVNRPHRDLTGQTFNLLTVIALTGKSHPKEGKIWSCKCVCGNAVEVTTQRLTGGSKKHCGCSRNYNKNLAGQDVNFFHVLGRLEEKKSGCSVYLCRCTCGKEIPVRTKDLSDGRVRSCGCQTRQFHWKGFGLISGTFWSRVISNAKQRGISVEVTIEDAWRVYEEQNGRCALSGVTIGFGTSSREHQTGHNTASLDRINSSLGYVPGNVQWLHKTVNLMKQTLSIDEFVFFSKQVGLHHGLIDSAEGQPLRLVA